MLLSHLAYAFSHNNSCKKLEKWGGKWVLPILPQSENYFQFTYSFVASVYMFLFNCNYSCG